MLSAQQWRYGAALLSLEQIVFRGNAEPQLANIYRLISNQMNAVVSMSVKFIHVASLLASEELVLNTFGIWHIHILNDDSLIYLSCAYQSTRKKWELWSLALDTCSMITKDVTYQHETHHEQKKSSKSCSKYKVCICSKSLTVISVLYYNTITWFFSGSLGALVFLSPLLRSTFHPPPSVKPCSLVLLLCSELPWFAFVIHQALNIEVLSKPVFFAF